MTSCFPSSLLRVKCFSTMLPHLVRQWLQWKLVYSTDSLNFDDLFDYFLQEIKDWRWEQPGNCVMVLTYQPIKVMPIVLKPPCKKILVGL